MATITVSSKIGIYAPSGYGKSYLANHIIENIPKKVYVYDTDLEGTEAIYFKSDNVVIYTPDATKSEDLSELNRFLAHMATIGNSFIYIEDLDLFFDVNSQLGYNSSMIKYFASKGRHIRTGLIYTAKQFTHIPTKLRANTNLFYIGKFASEIELKSIKKILSKEAYEAYLSLNGNNHEFLEYDMLSGDFDIIVV
jgi:GTPase SAR1 family protein